MLRLQQTIHHGQKSMEKGVLHELSSRIGNKRELNNNRLPPIFVHDMIFTPLVVGLIKIERRVSR